MSAASFNIKVICERCERTGTPCGSENHQPIRREDSAGVDGGIFYTENRGGLRVTTANMIIMTGT